MICRPPRSSLTADLFRYTPCCRSGVVTRAPERVTIANQVRNARFGGHGDHETAAEAAARVLLALGPGLREIGTEQWSSGLPDGLAKALARALPQVRWHDISGQKIGRASCRERVGQYV